MSFSNMFFLFQQEGFLIRSCISRGLTEIRNANLDDKGRFYTGFFNLSIGVERLAKIILILEHMVTSNNLAPPDQKMMRSYGHDILKLYSLAEKIACAKNYSFAKDFQTSSIGLEILDFLSRFAKGARYANLDALTASTSWQEPLACWNKILVKIITKDVSDKKRQKIINRSNALTQLMQNFTFVIAHDLENNPLSVQDWLTIPQLYHEAARHTIWYIILLISPLKELLQQLSDEAQNINLAKDKNIAHIPYMSEFFDFLWVNRQYVMRKRQWH